MRVWKVATLRLSCDREPYCGIAEGKPYLEISGPWGPRVMRRCYLHADEPVPDRIEPVTVVRPPKPTSDAKPLRWLATEAERKIARMTPRGDFDARAKAARNES